MRLFIAEKTSAAKAIASELGQTGKGDGFIQYGTDTVIWCFGHRLEQAEPDDYNPDDVPRNGSGKKVWRVDELPIIPADWILQPKDDAKKPLAMIGKRLKEASEIVNAGDPDREGQLQVDEVLEHFRCNKPARCSWVSAQDAVSVKRGLAALKDNGTYYGWGDAARARQRAESPHAGGTFLASWRGKEDQAGIDSEGRLGDTAMANTVVATVTGRPGTVAEYKQEAKKPKLKGRPDDNAVRETSEEQ